MNNKSKFFKGGIAFLSSLVFLPYILPIKDNVPYFEKHEIRIPAQNIVRGSTKVETSLERIILEQYEDGIVSSTDFKKYFENRFNKNLTQILTRFVNLKSKIENLEDRLFIPDYRFLLMSESKLDIKAQSPTFAKGIAQLTTDGVKGLIEDLQRDEEALSNFFNIDIINGLVNDRSFYFNPFEEILPYENYGFRRDLLEKKENENYGSEWQISRIRLPRYILLKKFLGSGIDFKLAFKDWEHNLNVGAAIFFSYKLELTYFASDYNYAKEHPEFLNAAYNRGITKVKNIILNNSRSSVTSNLYNFMNHLDSKQAESHNNRFSYYRQWFAELNSSKIKI